MTIVKFAKIDKTSVNFSLELITYYMRGTYHYIKKIKMVENSYKYTHPHTPLELYTPTFFIPE